MCLFVVCAGVLVCLPACLLTCLLVHLCVRVCVFVLVCLSVCLSFCLLEHFSNFLAPECIPATVKQETRIRGSIRISGPSTHGSYKLRAYRGLYFCSLCGGARACTVEEASENMPL